jgi:hypothetical protein
LAPYAGQYATIVAPVEVAIEVFESRSRALAPGASVDDFVVIARPLADVMAKVDIGLRQVNWPATVLHPIKAEPTSRSARSPRYARCHLDLDVWRHQVVSAANKVRAVAHVVSIDLGLLRPSGS